MRGSRIFATAVLVAAAAWPEPACAADAPWEQEVQRATEEQDREIERAQRDRSMPFVVSRYASRASREPTAFNSYLLGRALYYNEDPVGARAQMTAAIQIDPGFWPAHLRLAKLLYDLKNPAEAERHLREVLERKPGHADALRLLTNVAMDAKQWDRALGLLNQLAARFPEDVGVRRYLVSVHVQRKDWPAVIANLKAIQSREPGDSDLVLRLGHAYSEAGNLDAAVAEYDRFAAARPDDARGWSRLYEIHMERRAWERARAALERLLPLLPAERQEEASRTLAALRTDPESLVAPPPEARPPTWPEVFAELESGDAEKRQAALRTILSGIDAGALDRVPQEVLAHAVEAKEPDWRCRALVVKLLARFGAQGLPVLGAALHDKSEKVRVLAAEAIGDVGAPAGIVYLLPRLWVDDPLEHEAIRSALSSLVGFQDRPDGSPVVRPEDVDQSREAWRRWNLSDASRAAKLAAIEQFPTLREPLPERYLVDFVADPSFDVMRAGYVALRKVASRPGVDPVSTKLLPRFPRFDDAEVTRASMRTIQDRVRAWWDEWHAEHRALLRARGN